MEYFVEVNPRYKALQPKIDELMIKGMPKEAVVIYRGRNVLYRTTIGGISLIVKEFKKPNWINSYVYRTFRKSKAARSFMNAIHMTQLGFNTPAPVAYGEERKGLRLGRSIYVSLELKNATEMRNWENRNDSSHLTKAFADEIHRLHQAGVWHKDFSPGNILFSVNANGAYVFNYVDLNRMKFNVHDQKILNRMFRAINLNPIPLRRLAREYAQASDLDPDTMESEALRQLNGYFAVQKRKKFFKSIFK